jgi:phage shock protein A
MLDKANAMAELNKSGNQDTIKDLESKYSETSGSTAVDDELAKLKAEMGL